MKMTMTYPITQIKEKVTVKQYLLNLGYSQSLIRQLRNTENGIMVGGESVYTTRILKPGDSLSVFIREDESSENIVPTPMAIQIEYEDEHILVVNKEAGIPIHPSQGNFDHTLANGTAYYFKEKGESFIYRAINRLDRDTTGLLILAKNPLSACILSDMVQKREIRRRYLAVACGKLPLEGTIDAPIARVEGSTIERCVDRINGEEARTHYKRLYYDPVTGHSLVSLCLETGRTHQIRVHLKSIGHPIPGDFLYHPDYGYIKRQALHSFRLDFLHPIKKEPLSFEAPLPEDMQFLGITSTEGLWDNDF
ncbi:RluA family pseudouridine synthase [Lacrimispora indolis]|uniref:RluA family pseudouridine synthase n=1 Tax=Lacrimispora indolis TaxID=69825 RepID=UPI000426C4FF|nr:RluA family pseudouridine synthase [[Clostridium] methoxybenzovorans]MBE7720356.1 RluA family pseudouridine synthase [Lacrimispora celerecrescens]